MATARPVFLHSLFCTAGNHLFRKFCANESFSCYPEPFYEGLVVLNDPRLHGRLLELAARTEERLLPDKPYFLEFWEARRHLAGLFRGSFAYHDYFTSGDSLPAPQRVWLSAIIDRAPARPVLQMFRSAGRIAAIRSFYGGTHLHLWREPRAHWWSCKTTGYFERISRRIYRAKHLPDALRLVRRMARIPRLRSRHPEPRGDYMMFYGLWLDAWLRLSAGSDLSINVDRITSCPADNTDCAGRFAELIDCPIDIADMRLTGMAITAEEAGFYEEVEEAVKTAFMRAGHGTAEALQAAAVQAASARSAHAGRSCDPSAEQNLRLAALSLMHCLAGGGRPGGSRWPRRWYPKRFHDYVRWSIQRLQQRQRDGRAAQEP